MRIGDMLTELASSESDYPPDTVYKAIQRLTAEPGDNTPPTVLQRLDRHWPMLGLTPETATA